MPWPWKGTMACAASPSRSTLPPMCQGARCTVPSWPCGWAANSCSRASGRGVGKFALGRIRPRRPGLLERETVGAGAGQEQGRGETAVGVGQGDQHEAAARPDVERVRIQHVPATGDAGMVSSL
jgi:hypothetical protein